MIQGTPLLLIDSRRQNMLNKWVGKTERDIPSQAKVNISAISLQWDFPARVWQIYDCM